MVLIRNIGDTMECGTYYAKDQKMIVLQKESGWKKEIKYIIKSYSSMMLSFVLLCYPDADTEEEETKGCVTLYHDEEAIIDDMLKSAIEDACINLDLYYGDEGMSVQ